MATKTTNYQLIKPAGNEAADITAINANMDIIDSALRGQEQRISSAEEAAESILNKVNRPGTNPNGSPGQILKTNGDGTTRWDDPISAEQVAPAVVTWMDENISGASAPVVLSLGDDQYKLVFGGT